MQSLADPFLFTCGKVSADLALDRLIFNVPVSQLVCLFYFFYFNFVVFSFLVFFPFPVSIVSCLSQISFLCIPESSFESLIASLGPIPFSGSSHGSSLGPKPSDLHHASSHFSVVTRHNIFLKLTSQYFSLTSLKLQTQSVSTPCPLVFVQTVNPPNSTQNAS